MPRLRVQVNGSIGTLGPWSNTFEFILSASVASQATLQTISDAVRTALGASLPFKQGFCADTSFSNVKLLHYPVTTGKADLVAQSAASGVQGAQTQVHAPQVCVVASLRTGNAGRSQRGRVYVPYRAGQVSALGVVSSTAQSQVAGYANAVPVAVVAACASASIGASWVVWSPSKGTAAPVTAVLVGTQCDTIRHRNDNRAEVYTSFSVLAAPVAPENATAEEYLNAVKNGEIKFDGPNGPSFTQALVDLLPIP